MFSFHKPKVYRSSTGCCICKAKSSSSRFTDSKKYEEDFVKCFQLEERRTGEICNACVLLVKRWKKLPAGSSRNWRHVVDARAGPGIKSLTKFKAKNKKKVVTKEEPEKFEKILKKKRVCLKNDRDREQSPAISDDLTEEYLPGTGSKGSSRAGSPAESDDIAVGEKRLDIDQEQEDISNFIDLTYFKRKNVCCGVIFVGMMGEVLIEPSLFKPCIGCLARQQRQRVAATATMAGASPAHSSASASPCHSSASTSPAHSVESGTEGSVVSGKGKGFCDSSSDSGYDDSNQGIAGESKKHHQQQPPKPPTAQALDISAKPVKPVSKVQALKSDKIMPVSTSVRLKANSIGGTKVPIKLLCKPVALVSSAKLSLSGTPRAVDAALTVPTAVDFSLRSASQRQSLAN
ncbi:uncharacterized protein LOC100120919 isoform X2 [Nasonia vitripennis]|nr:uncharacterized protein LOC100120919 isoform X2 [Nasonia vitripennis]XP_003425042.1 uncharacterized protein LOC100120919 isoform X2 [Nasonia vitripennis]XP_008216456.1 uncharacterized protein LOC100120919 isoform X2 [Nasonia vitripennis]XP_008216464.1 uncharacterized protein LOC100120919 isoform X2 [Nasonia vitripennis]XP_031784029.1 uncharacterized protein LOC100120919 isoform X2 [Nasonia vitripennis]